jgi:hypothetical protein
MKKKRGKKSNRGRKPNRAILSGTKPHQETFDEIRCRFIYGSAEWAMVALQNLINNGSQLPSNYLSAPSDVHCASYAQRPAGVFPLWNKLCYEFEQAVLNGDADWFRRQANAIEKGGSPQRAQFYEKVVPLLDRAWGETQGRPENWRPLTDAEREAYPTLPPRVPHVVTFTPAGKLTDKTASDIWKAVVDAALKEPETNSLIEQQLAAWERFGFCKGLHNNKRQIIEQVVAEIYGFKTKAKAIDAIHKIATLLQFKVKKQARKR